MSLRTPNPISNQQSLLDLQRLKERFAVVQEQLSTGKRISRLGEDPTSAALIIDFKHSIEQNNSFANAIGSARSFLQSTETVTSSLESAMVRLMELAEQGANDPSGASGRLRISKEVDGIRTQILDLSNTQFEGRYLFSGTRTTVKPFAGPAAGPIAYAGDANSITLDVSSTTSMSINLTGDRVFFGAGGQGSATDVFQAVTDLRDALVTNDPALIQNAYARIKSGHNGLNDLISDLGGRQSTLDQLESNLQEYNLSLKAIQGTYEDLDYPSAITEFNKIQTVQQAALGTLAKSGKLNLFDYIG